MVSNEYEDYSDAVLYDVFYEAGTMLGGWLSAKQMAALERGDAVEAQRWEQARFDVDDERSEVNPHDRAAQIAKIKEWNAFRAELDAQEVLVAS